ncbi:hypothetical protein M3Y97_00839400 [Aphelenchoides bicaudatus]|nr:hypothetical protein M3Y97_00839400 [Aphelenchoides bicaudatus]
MDQVQQDALKQRLRSLNITPTSIQTLSLWILHHKDYIDKIAKIWAKEVCTFTKGGPDWLSAAFFVANDAIQNSRKNKAPEIVKAFFYPLRSAVEHVGQNKQKIPQKTVNSIERVVKILGERGIYTTKQIEELISALDNSQKEKDVEAQILKKYEHNIDERLKIRNKAFNEAIDSLKSLSDPPSADTKTRQLIATFPESIADPKNLNPTAFDEVSLLLKQTTEAHRVVSDYAKNVRDEKVKVKELVGQMKFLDNLLCIESRLSKELLFKSQDCMNLLYKKRDKLKQEKSMLPDEPSGLDSGPLPDLGDEDF